MQYYIHIDTEYYRIRLLSLLPRCWSKEVSWYQQSQAYYFSRFLLWSEHSCTVNFTEMSYFLENNFLFKTKAYGRDDFFLTIKLFCSGLVLFYYLWLALHSAEIRIVCLFLITVCLLFLFEFNFREKRKP